MATPTTVRECPDCTMPAEREDGYCQFCAEYRARVARGYCGMCGDRSPSPEDGGNGTECYLCAEDVACLFADARDEFRGGQ